MIALESKKRYPLIPNQKICDILFQNVNFICFDLVGAHKDSRIVACARKFQLETLLAIKDGKNLMISSENLPSKKIERRATIPYSFKEKIGWIF